MTNKFLAMSPEELVDNAGAQPPGVIPAAFMRLQTMEMARSARYMRWSVYSILATSVTNAFFTFLIWYAPHAPK